MIGQIADLLAGLVPQAIKDALKPLLDKVEGLLQGEPARLIGYGAAIVIYLVAAAFKAIPDVSFDQAVIDATSAIALLVTVVEFIRAHVYSPATVAAMGGANPPAGVAPVDGGIG